MQARDTSRYGYARHVKDRDSWRGIAAFVDAAEEAASQRNE